MLCSECQHERVNNILVPMYILDPKERLQKKKERKKGKRKRNICFGREKLCGLDGKFKTHRESRKKMLLLCISYIQCYLTSAEINKALRNWELKSSPIVTYCGGNNSSNRGWHSF